MSREHRQNAIQCLNELVYTGSIIKFEIPKHKQIIQQKLKLSENHPDRCFFGILCLCMEYALSRSNI